MPVYLVVFQLQKNADPSRWSLLEAWGRFVKGPVDHVELAFVSPGRPVYGFGITAASKTTRFGQRVYDEAKQKARIAWYEVPDVDEKKCEAHCMQRAGRDRMSLWLMAKSAAPFESDRLARAIMGVVGDLGDQAPGPEGADDALPPAFCSTTTIRALQAGNPAKLADVRDPERHTANDVVALAVRRLGARRVEGSPAADTKPRPAGEDAEDDAGMIRSERWA